MSLVSPAVPAAVELRGITVTYGSGEALHAVIEDLDLVVPSGTIHCLAGRSGSGKTTVLRVAVATQAPSEGTVAWAGLEIGDLAPSALAAARRKHMAYVDQGATAIPELSVLDNVLIPVIPQGIDGAAIERAVALLERFGLVPLEQQRASTLSGGERQRLAIARALMLEPTTVALDEPTASLDRATAAVVVETLHNVAAGGSAVLVASHDAAVIAAADTVTHLD